MEGCCHDITAAMHHPQADSCGRMTRGTSNQRIGGWSLHLSCASSAVRYTPGSSARSCLHTQTAAVMKTETFEVKAET